MKVLLSLGAVLAVGMCAACSSGSSENGAPAYTLAQTKRLFVTSTEAGLPTWRTRTPRGEQMSQTTLALEFFSRSAYSPATEVALEVGHSEAVMQQTLVLSAPLDKQDLRDPHSTTIRLRARHGVIKGTELTGYDTEFKQQQIKIDAVVGPILTTVTGSDKTVVEQIAKAQVAKLPAAS